MKLAATRHDIYHIPEYLQIASLHEGGQPTAFILDAPQSFLVPLLDRSLPPELGAPESWRDLTSPYGYPCPLLAPGSSDQDLMDCLDAFRREASQREKVTAFIRLHPLLPLSPTALEHFGTLIRHGETVYIDLTKPLETLEAETRINHRRQIRRLEASGLTVSIDDWSAYPDFIRIYRAGMERVAADTFYMFEGAYFDELRARLGGRVHLACVRSAEGAVAAAALFTAEGGIVQYHLGGTAEEFRRDAPFKLLLYVVRRWAKDQGFQYFHLGGGAGGQHDALFSFKAGFSPNRAVFYTLRMILDTHKYDVLMDAWARKHVGKPETDSGFFPAYRLP